jgi:hypothetical protein
MAVSAFIDRSDRASPSLKVQGRVLGEAYAKAVDQYATAWTARRVEVCTLALSGGDEAKRDQVTANRMDCLRKRLGTLDVVVSIFTHAPWPAVPTRLAGVALAEHHARGTRAYQDVRDLGGSAISGREARSLF